jgi:hypothetical protein
MPVSQSDVIERWWPTTQSLDIVLGRPVEVAAAVEAEVRRFICGERVLASWTQFANLDVAFAAAPEFANVPTFYLVLPSRSPWSVLWNNSFLCDGYDSLCWNLTRNHGLTTVHWSAHDEQTTFQPGAVIPHRRCVEGEFIERQVYVGKEDRRWLFFEKGEPIPEEDTSAYLATRKRDRLNEASVARLLSRLGASPWSEDFYAVGDQPSFCLSRPDAPATVSRRSRSQVVTGRQTRRCT